MSQPRDAPIVGWAILKRKPMEIMAKAANPVAGKRRVSVDRGGARLS
jgi:hypothetical protein